MRVRVFLVAFALALIGTLAFAGASATGADRVLATVLTGAAEEPGPGEPTESAPR
jgi:hypothetical protein